LANLKSRKMIYTKEDLKVYLHADLVANKFDKMSMRWLNVRYNFLHSLRWYEYAINNKNYPPHYDFFSSSSCID